MIWPLFHTFSLATVATTRGWCERNPLVSQIPSWKLFGIRTISQQGKQDADKQTSDK